MAIEELLRGGAWIEPAMTTELVQRTIALREALATIKPHTYGAGQPDVLTRRQNEVLELLAGGFDQPPDRRRIVYLDWNGKEPRSPDPRRVTSLIPRSGRRVLSILARASHRGLITNVLVCTPSAALFGLLTIVIAPILCSWRDPSAVPAVIERHFDHLDRHMLLEDEHASGNSLRYELTS